MYLKCLFLIDILETIIREKFVSQLRLYGEINYL